MERKRSLDQQNDEASGVSPPKSPKTETKDSCGTSGIPVKLHANYFKVEKLPKFQLTQYRVDFEPNIDVTMIRKKIVNENRKHFGDRFLFDGASLYLPESGREGQFTSKYEEKKIKIKIKETGHVDSNSPMAFQLYNLILREAMAGLKLQQVRRDYFDPNAKIDVPQGKLELWPGYLTSIREHEDEVLLNAEISHKFMRKETVLRIADRLVKEDPKGWKEKLSKAVIGITVLTDYNNKTYAIDDIDFSKTPKSTFTTTNGDEMTFVEYYKTHYDKEIEDKYQFILVSVEKRSDSQSKEPKLIHLIPELCRATGMTDEMRADRKLMQEVSQYTRLNPKDRFNALKKFNQRLQSNSTEILSSWQMKLSPDLLEVTGRELTAELIRFGGVSEQKTSDKGDWRLGRDCKLFQPMKLKRWLVIYPKSMKDETENFRSVLMTKLDVMGCERSDPLMKCLEDDKQDTYLTVIREVAPKNPKMILIVLPTNRADRYSTVKKECLVTFGIPSQVVIKRTIQSQNVGSIAEKVAIQMNVKLGGLPWMIKLPVKGLMTVGFDVSHHPRDKNKSCGALVATMDLNQSGVFYSGTSAFQNGQEITKLADHMQKAIEIYKETCKAFPEKILFYRDGVGDGQIQHVMEKEVKPLIAKLKSIFQEDPKLAYIIVNKRTNTRFFKKAGVNFFNAKPGTVVDTKITLPDRNDFFLVSQHVNTGTVTPTSYNIIHNTIGLNKDKLEILTYKFTHLYFNWSGTTRIPAVSQYAKKLAFLTSQSLGANVHENLEKTLYFL